MAENDPDLPAIGLVACFAAGREADLAPAEERFEALGADRPAFDACGRDAFRALAELFDLAPVEGRAETVLRFLDEAPRAAVPRLAGDLARLLADLLLLREAEAERDFEAELRAATFDFEELRTAEDPRLPDFFAELREEPDRPAEAFFELARARPRLDAPADFLDEPLERPEDLDEPRLLDAITTPFDVSALSEQIDR